MRETRSIIQKELVNSDKYLYDSDVVKEAKANMGKRTDGLPLLLQHNQTL